VIKQVYFYCTLHSILWYQVATILCHWSSTSVSRHQQHSHGQTSTILLPATDKKAHMINIWLLDCGLVTADSMHISTCEMIYHDKSYSTQNRTEHFKDVPSH